MLNCLTPSISQLHQHQSSTLGHIQALTDHLQLAINLLGEVQVIQRFHKPRKGIQLLIFYLYALFAYTLDRLEPGLDDPIALMIPVSYVCYKASRNV